jgi:hypothetical protein
MILLCPSERVISERYPGNIWWYDMNEKKKKNTPPKNMRIRKIESRREMRKSILVHFFHIRTIEVAINAMSMICMKKPTAQNPEKNTSINTIKAIKNSPMYRV